MIIIYVARIHFLSSISHNLTEANILEKNISKKIYYFKSENLFARAFYFYASKSVGIIIILFVTKKKKRRIYDIVDNIENVDEYFFLLLFAAIALLL